MIEDKGLEITPLGTHTHTLDPHLIHVNLTIIMAFQPNRSNVVVSRGLWSSHFLNPESYLETVTGWRIT